MRLNYGLGSGFIILSCLVQGHVKKHLGVEKGKMLVHYNFHFLPRPRCLLKLYSIPLRITRASSLEDAGRKSVTFSLKSTHARTAEPSAHNAVSLVRPTTPLNRPAVSSSCRSGTFPFTLSTKCGVFRVPNAVS